MLYFCFITEIRKIKQKNRSLESFKDGLTNKDVNLLSKFTTPNVFEPVWPVFWQSHCLINYKINLIMPNVEINTLMYYLNVKLTSNTKQTNIYSSECLDLKTISCAL